MARRSVYLILLILSGLWSACDRNAKPLDTPTSGSINVAVDESFRPVIEAEEYMFESVYKRAHLDISYKPEQDVIKDLLNDSTHLAILSRELNKDERAYFEKIKIIPRTTKVAVDALALIVNRGNNDTLATVSKIFDVLKGNIRKWDQLASGASKENIELVFDHKNSSTVRYMLEQAGIKDLSAAKVFAATSNEEVIAYVEKNRNAIGVIGVNWISDGDDSASVSFLDRVRVMEIAPDLRAPGAGSYYKPYQAYIAQGYYPFCRNLYVISTEGRAGLGIGFASFIASDRGQRIVMKAGLLPATVPIRLVEIKNE